MTTSDHFEVRIAQYLDMAPTHLFPNFGTIPTRCTSLKRLLRSERNFSAKFCCWRWRAREKRTRQTATVDHPSHPRSLMIDIKSRPVLSLSLLLDFSGCRYKRSDSTRVREQTHLVPSRVLPRQLPILPRPPPLSTRLFTSS